MGAWRGFFWPRDQGCLGTHYVLGREVCAFTMGLPSLGTPCWYLASDMPGLETYSAAPVGRWMPMASWDSVMGGRVPAALPGGVLWLALPHHCLLPSPGREALQGQRWSPTGPRGICCPAGSLYLLRARAPWGASLSSSNSPDKGLCSWLVRAVQNTQRG